MEIQGGDKLEKVLAEIGEKMSGSVRVGFLEGGEYPDGTPFAAVAFWNEFGTTRIPARPFFRTAITEKSGEWADRVAKFATRYEYDSARVLDGMGETMANDIQQSLVAWSEPQNAASTIAKKGFNDPLIDDGTLQTKVEYEVEP